MIVDFSNIGSNIRELRKALGISQKKLAEGICTQAQISKIENGSIYPLSTTLYLISRRLGVDVNYFFDVCETPRLDYVNEVFELIRKFIRKREYEKVFAIVKVEKDNPLFQSIRNRQFIIWHEGICIYYLQKDKEKALETLNRALSLTLSANYSSRELEILNSIGIIHCEEDEYAQANACFEKAISQYQMFPIKNDVNIIIRLYYNYAKSLTKIQEYDKSIQCCDQGIKTCLDHEMMYSLGELFYHKGYNLYKKRKIDEAIYQMKKAIQIFELQKNQTFLDYVQKKIDEIMQEERRHKLL